MNQKELRLILEEGEGYRIEFKEYLSSFDKELVAFANSSGGRILLGITDDGKVKGIDITNKLRSQIQDIARNCQPEIKVHFEELGNVLILHVLEGEDKPYKSSSGFYTRIGPNSQKLSRNEIIEFFKAEGKVKFDELMNLKFEYERHFDAAKLDRFLRLAGISRVLDTPIILVNLSVAEKQEGKVIFNNTGILFFAKSLQDIYFHTAVTCALYKGVDKVEVLDRKDFNEDIVSSIDNAMIFLKQHIPVRYEMTGTPQRKEIPEMPYDALREAVINAVAHRDYFEKGSNVMVEMFDDRIEISFFSGLHQEKNKLSNFGGLVRGLSPEDFGKKSVLRNPNIANLLHRIKYIEKMGTGINKMRRLVAEAGLAPVEFEFGTFFTVIFRKPERKEAFVVTENFRENFSVKFSVKGKTLDRLIAILTRVIQEKPLSRDELAAEFDVSTRTIYEDMRRLREWNILMFEGAPKTGRYVLTEEGDKFLEQVGMR